LASANAQVPLRQEPARKTLRPRPREAQTGSDLGFVESGRRESNSRSQLGKLMFCL
jgi:hypothetical protein